MEHYGPPSPALSDMHIKTELHEQSQLQNFVQYSFGQDNSQSHPRYSTPPTLNIYRQVTSASANYSDLSDRTNMLQTQFHPYATPMASPLPKALASKNVISRPNLRPQRSSTPKSSIVLSGAVEKFPGKRKPPSKSRTARQSSRLQQPLSQMAHKFPSTEIINIETFIQRPYTDRHIELQTSKSPGKVKRPMNAFMLYRKAYQNLAKAVITENNHQVVSQICGDSWAIETMSVREQFNRWAKIERVNHQAAHPGYKFSPSKNAAPTPQQSLGESDDIDADGEVDLDISVIAQSPTLQYQARVQQIRSQSFRPPTRDQTPARSVRDEKKIATDNPEANFKEQTSFLPTSYPVDVQDYPGLSADSQTQFSQESMYSNMSQEAMSSFDISVEGPSSQSQDAFLQAVIDPQMGCAEDPGSMQPHSYFDEWAFPFGPDSMTVLDSMMNLDPQMSYLASTWKLEA